MQKYFRPDSPFMSFIGKLADTLLLNILWLIFCLPVFTIGPSTAALYTVTLKMAGNEETQVLSSFLEAFRRNFRKGTVLGMIMTAAGAVLLFDGLLFRKMALQNAFWAISCAVFIAAALFYTFVLLYVFPLQAYFENDIRSTLKNAFLIGVRYLFCTLLILAIHVFILLFSVYVFTPFLFLGEGLAAFLSSYFLLPVFAKLSGKAEETGLLYEER